MCLSGVKHPSVATALCFLMLSAVSSLHALSQPSPPNAPAAPFAPPSEKLIHDENDLAQQIRAVQPGPTIVTLLLPPTLQLTKALPVVMGPVQLVANNGPALVTCSSSMFTALTVNTSSFVMTGITWTGCGTVLVLESLLSGTDSNVTISSCSFLGNSIDPNAVSCLCRFCCLWMSFGHTYMYRDLSSARE